MAPLDPPPPVLDMARVIAYAFVDDSVQWTGRQCLFVDGKELGPVPRLALAQNATGDLTDVLVFHCDERWEVLGVSGGANLDEAKARTEHAYRGISAKWIDANVSVEEAEAWVLENSDHMVCFFCGRSPGQFEQIVTGKLAAICNVCIDRLHRELHEEGNGHEA